MSGLLALPKRYVGPVGFRVAPLTGAVAAVRAAVPAAESGVAVHFANAYTVALADSDPTFARLLDDPAAACFTDGVPVVWFGRRGNPDLADIWQRVYGPDVMRAVLATEGPRHFLLGGDPETLAALQERIAEEFPRAVVVGAASPPFREPTEAELAERDAAIRRSGATHVWVGLGTPKQDWEVARLARELPVVALAVGAAFDFLAGTKSQAPHWMQRSGLEWAYRLGTEPRRLARRYFWGNPRFVRAAVRRSGPPATTGQTTPGAPPAG